MSTVLTADRIIPDRDSNDHPLSPSCKSSKPVRVLDGGLAQADGHNRPSIGAVSDAGTGSAERKPRRRSGARPHKQCVLGGLCKGFNYRMKLEPTRIAVQLLLTVEGLNRTQIARRIDRPYWLVRDMADRKKWPPTTYEDDPRVEPNALSLRHTRREWVQVAASICEITGMAGRAGVKGFLDIFGRRAAHSRRHLTRKGKRARRLPVSFHARRYCPNLAPREVIEAGRAQGLTNRESRDAWGERNGVDVTPIACTVAKVDRGKLPAWTVGVRGLTNGDPLSLFSSLEIANRLLVEDLLTRAESAKRRGEARARPTGGRPAAHTQRGSGMTARSARQEPSSADFTAWLERPGQGKSTTPVSGKVPHSDVRARPVRDTGEAGCVEVRQTREGVRQVSRDGVSMEVAVAGTRADPHMRRSVDVNAIERAAQDFVEFMADSAVLVEPIE